MKKLLVIFLILIPFFAYGQRISEQKGSIEGIVTDSWTHKSIYSASISLLTLSDSLFVKGILTDSIGQFKISVPEKSKYILKISILGYESSFINVETTAEHPHLKLGNIQLKDKAILLTEAVIMGDIPPIIVKGDTIEYNSGSYIPDEHAMLKDLINNIPGLEADEYGNILANGKPITKIMVDGKEFFGNDIPLALSSLPADMIKKLQIFKDESETAKITGFKDKDPEQVLNLVVKDELKRSILGEAQSGYGSDERYTASASSQYMNDERQLTFLGRASNITDSPWAVSNQKDKEQTAGTNIYIIPLKKMKLGIYGRYSGDNNVSETYDNTEYYLENGDRISKQNMLSRTDANRISTGFNLSWEIDSMTMIYARMAYVFSDTKNINKSNGVSYVQEAVDTTTSNYRNETKGDSYSLNNAVTIGKRLNKNGRTISLSLDYTTRNNNSRGTNNSSTIYTGSNPSIYLDQKIKSKNNSQSYGFSVDYVEPAGKDNMIKFSYSLNRNDADLDKKTWKKDNLGNYTIMDSAYTRETKNDNTNQRFSIDFMSIRDKFNYSVGFSVDPSSSHSQVWMLDSIIDNLRQNVVNYSPSFNFSYEPSSNSSLDFNYYGNTGQPTTRQLSADTTIINATNKTYGNPGLKPSYTNRMDITYQKSDYEKGRFIIASLGANYTFNSIVSYSNIDNLGNSENTFRNVDGNVGANASFLINTPLRNKKFTINSSTNINYDRRVGYSNNRKAKTYNYVISENSSFKYKIKKFENTFRAGVTFNIAENNLSQVENQNTTIYKLQNSFTWKLSFDIILQSDIVYSHFSGFGSDFKENETLWNASISKNFLKNKKANIKFEIFDMLNDRNNLKRVVTSNFSSDSRTNTISRYFLITFSYKFNVFKGGQDNTNNISNI